MHLFDRCLDFTGNKLHGIVDHGSKCAIDSFKNVMPVLLVILALVAGGDDRESVSNVGGSNPVGTNRGGGGSVGVSCGVGSRRGK